MEREKIPAEEQQRRYSELEKATSINLAYFYCCIVYDVPFAPGAIPGADVKNKWVEYLKNLARMPDHLDKEGKYRKFVDGKTDIRDLLRGGEDGLPGTPEQREIWGPGPNKHPYTTDDYEELDRTYKILSGDLEQAGGVSSKQEFILRRCAKRTLEMNLMENMGSYDKAMKLSKMIDTDMASEQLRKKDAKPIEDFRMDSWADALEKSGLTKDGKRCSPDEMFEILFRRPPQYPYTMDAAEQLILINENRMRNNDGHAELSVLPDNMRLHDDLGEFAPEQSAGEREAYEILGLVNMPPPGVGSGWEKEEN